MFTVPGEWLAGGGVGVGLTPRGQGAGVGVGKLKHLHSAPWVPEDKGPLPFCGWAMLCWAMYGWDSGKKLPLSQQLHVSLRDPYTRAEFSSMVARSTRTLSSELAPQWTWACVLVPKVPTYPSAYRRGTTVGLGKAPSPVSGPCGSQPVAPSKHSDWLLPIPSSGNCLLI